jgi:hypothetical protein
MKKLVSLFAMFFFFNSAMFAQVGINADNSLPDASAGLDVNFNALGFLPPRVALTAINSALPVTDPAEGLLVYNTAVAGTPPNNVLPGYYCRSGAKWIPVVAPPGTNVGEMQYWNGTQWVGIPAGLNGQVLTFANGIPTWAYPVTDCGFTMTVNHLASGGVAPVDKMVVYGTVTNVPGESTKCWITSNLGSDHQATAKNDATEASAGWYWQFNLKQGYKHDGTTRTPNTTWIGSISETSDWISTNDPCHLELGSWRIPTYTEWYNVDNTGGWGNSNGPWNSALKLHAAGYLSHINGSVVTRGSNGNYSSSVQNTSTNSWSLYFGSGLCNMIGGPKTDAYSIRCVRDF